MQKVSTIKALRESIKRWRKQSKTIAFVPTMGNLHAGHLKLVTEARKKADRVIVSIFVNPTQFCAEEDFETYPKTEVEDEAKLRSVFADLLFLPSAIEMYHKEASTVVSVVELSKLHCGASRPGHFDGVATIVAKLLHMVQPDIAVFGEKDFQQLMLIRNMVRDLNIPVEIIGVETQRELDGLAMSSRNSSLTDKERSIAPNLYLSLCNARDAILLKNQSLRDIEQQQKELLESLGFKIDYFSICKREELQEANDNDRELVIIAAVKLRKPRLIDNIYFSK